MNDTTTTTNPGDALGTIAADTGMRAAVAWVQRRRPDLVPNLRDAVRCELLLTRLRVLLSLATGEALDDAKTLTETGNGGFAAAAFTAPFAEAGIEAAGDWANNEDSHAAKMEHAHKVFVLGPEEILGAANRNWS